MSLRKYYDRYRCQVLLACALAPALALVGCGSVPHSSSQAGAVPSSSRPSSASRSSSAAPVLPRAGSGRGGYYQDDGPGDAPPEGLMDVPDAEPKIEPYLPRSNRPYVVFGKTYTPMTDERPFKQRGVGSWYGKKFHGQKTSSGEPYDMYKMTAAHPTLPIPSYARVTNVATGKQVIVRINDRGPFHSGRIIDLSYTAALKLGYLGKGSSELEVERLLPDEIARIAGSRKDQHARAEQSLPTPDVLAAAAAVESAQRAESAGEVSQAARQDGIIPVAAQPEAPHAGMPIVAAAPPASPAIAAPGFYLQLGSFTQPDNAQAARSRLTQDAGGSLPPIEVVEYGLFYRLYSGPFATRSEAATAAQQLQDKGSFKPLVVQR
ncbi:septal ring lytic transglycosylase RlpA family protein [Noviherbaspirillum sp. UKPF54]|uniref:septal ring lytic transglycosylase RlpA family protein n=1 Tax=Noviherbaspirillum sp. UKPF54 TaxID=2601898 RepID=UPI0011B1243A|nr:septal ring lytic transglycosylase RlpA family protein [Noviherbaspirillum sp. UKPF54]QDZ29200.1 septal ring lytic transglycosylase RlpA family protein [Noviherbaspirillum sp. UKPF54]